MRYCFGLVFLVLLCAAQNGDPWPADQLVQPAALAAELNGSNPPVILCTAFSVLYRNKRITHAVEAGPGSKAEGIMLLKRAAAKLPKDAHIVIYCGCCPMVKCPNIRPAYRALHEMGFRHVRILDIPSNMHEDWFSKGYPSESGPPSAPPS